MHPYEKPARSLGKPIPEPLLSTGRSCKYRPNIEKSREPLEVKCWFKVSTQITSNNNILHWRLNLRDLLWQRSNCIEGSFSCPPIRKVSVVDCKLLETSHRQVDHRTSVTNKRKSSERQVLSRCATQGQHAILNRVSCWQGLSTGFCPP